MKKQNGFEAWARFDENGDFMSASKDKRGLELFTKATEIIIPVLITPITRKKK